MEEEELLVAAVDEYVDQKADDRTAEEKLLEQIVLGREADFEEALNDDRNLIAFSEDVDVEEPSVEPAAWQDDDDVETAVPVREQKRYKRFRETSERHISAETLSKRLRNEYEKNLPVPAWATQKPFEDDDDPTSSLSRSTGTYIDKRIYQLPLKEFSFKRLANLNFESPAQGIAHAVEFHPAAQVAMVGSYGRTVSLFQVDGKANPKLKTVQFEKFPVSGAHFLNNGNEFLACSKEVHHMYLFDLNTEKTVVIPWNKAIHEKGFKTFTVSPDFEIMAFQGRESRNGSIYLLSGKSKEWIGTLKMNGSVSSVAFSADSNHLYSIGEEGKVYIWDVKSKRCITSFMDDGCVNGTAISVSPNNNLVAVGSNTGVVNLYNRKDCSSGTSPQPVKTVLNLTTSITALKFNPPSEILALASSYSPDSVKLLHTGEMQIIPTFPGLEKKIRKAECMDFSLNSGYMGIGNNKGEALLYRLNHYKGF